MNPILFHFELAGRPFHLPAYGTAIALAMLCVALVGWRVAVAQGLPSRPALVCAVAAAVVLLAGSRVAYWLTQPEAWCQGPGFLGRPTMIGFALPGGIAAALLIAAGVCRLCGMSVWTMFDALAPALGLAGGVLRVGCFLNGCCFGRETALPWGVVFPLGSPAHLEQASRRFDLLFVRPLPVHPTQLYELAAALVAAGLALWLIRRRAPAGVPAMAALLWFVVFRWANRGLRPGDPLFSWPLYHLAQAGLLLGVTLMLWLRSRAGGGRAGPAHSRTPA